MIKLFRKLAEHRIYMVVENGREYPNEIHVMFRTYDYSRELCKLINLDEFKDVWGGDHVLENVLESYLDEFLKEVEAKRNVQPT